MCLKPVYTPNKKEQFYKIIRPLSLILKCLGFFPFQNCSGNNGLQLGYDRMTSYIHLILTLLAFTIPSLYVIFNAKQNFVMLSESVLAVTYVVCILNCFLTDHLLLETIHKFENYDKLYIKSNQTAVCNRFRYRGFVLFIVTIFLILFDVNFIEYVAEYEVLQYTELIEFVWMQLVQSAPWLAMIGGFYVQLCWELWIRFSELRQTISPSNLTGPKIEEARLLHGRLKDIHDMINSCFGFRLSLFSLYFLHSFLHLFYKVVVISKKVTLLALSAEIKRFIILYTICYSSEFAVIQNKRLVQHLQAISRSIISSPSKFQMELLIHQAESSSFAITAWGMFTVDREMYATLFVVVVTYVITVLQIPQHYNDYLLQAPD